MPVFSSLAAFFKRHKRKIIVAASVAISTYFLVNELVIKKFRNFQNSLKQELIFKQQIKQRFIQTQQDCYYTILALLPVLTTPVSDYLPTEVITQALKVKKQPLVTNATAALSTAASLTQDNLQLLDKADTKLQPYVNMLKPELWQKLKIKTITRTLTLAYLITALLLLTRLQLNILARRLYLEAAIQMAGVKPLQPPQGDNQDTYVTEQAYLLLSWWLLNKGWKQIANVIEPLVEAKFEAIKPKLELAIGEFLRLLLEVIDDIPATDMTQLLFPTAYDDLMETLANTNPQMIDQLDRPDLGFVKLINETTLIILDNVYCLGLFKLLIHHMLATLQYNLQVNLGEGAMGHSSLLMLLAEDVPPPLFGNDDKKFKLATFLAQLSVQLGVMADNNNIVHQQELENDDQLEGFIASLAQGQAQDQELTGNIYVNTLNDSEELDDFSAGIYSNFE